MAAGGSSALVCGGNWRPIGYLGPGREYTGIGSNTYHPRMMLGVAVLQYAAGTFFSRNIERKTYEHTYAVANQQPDLDTICMFRQLFIQILMIAVEMELVELGNVSIDGAKFKANTSKYNVLGPGLSAQRSALQRS